MKSIRCIAESELCMDKVHWYRRSVGEVRREGMTEIVSQRREEFTFYYCSPTRSEILIAQDEGGAEWMLLQVHSISAGTF